MVIKKITIRFVAFGSDFTRRPIAHTCGAVLEIPHNYDTFLQLRTEFNSVLESNIWVMDIA